MNQTYQTRSFTLVFALCTSVLLVLTSCGENKKSGTTVTSAARAAVPGGNPSLIPIYGGYSLGQGKIYTEPQYGREFSDEVKAVVSAYIDPENVGDVNPTDGVSFRAYVESGTTNGVNATNSGFEMDIRDSHSIRGVNDNGEKLEPIRLGASAVAMNVTNNSAVVTFKTTGAEYVFEGTFDQSNFTGAVKYRNLTSFSGAAPARSGVLGGFQIPTCQFFRCQ